MLFFKKFSLALLSLCMANQMHLAATPDNYISSEDYIQEIIDSEAEWDANQLSEMYTQLDIAARSSRDIGMHIAAKSSRDIGMHLAARSSRDIGTLFAAKSSRDIGV
jgi:hypothetical protein